MSKIPALTAVRLIPRDTEFLDRKFGNRGEIFYDRGSDTLRIYNSDIVGGIALAKNDLSNVPNATFLAKATASGVSGVEGGAASNSFSTIAVAGQTSVLADSPTDTLTLVAGSNITISTNAGTDTVTISSTGGGAASNSFSTIAVAGQTSVLADSATDTLTVIAGTGISISTNAINDSITINNSVSAFTGLSDVATAGLTVDQFYLPAMTVLVVTNSGASAYRFDQYGSGNNPTVFAITGMTIAFDLNVSGHPFLIQNPSGVNFNTGLIHVTPTGVVTTGAAAQGKDSGTLYWKVPTDISGGYRYQCSVHAPMVGSITVKTIGTL